jgi:predicted nucleic acid-binding protein
MSGKCFVDTNILIYAHNRSAGAKHQRAAALIEHLWLSGDGVLSTQVLQEFCINVRRKLPRPLSMDDTARVLQQYLHWQIVVNTPASVIEAMVLESRYAVSFWNALILSAAQAAGVKTMYSEDFSHGQLYGSIRSINPFQ